MARQISVTLECGHVVHFAGTTAPRPGDVLYCVGCADERSSVKIDFGRPDRGLRAEAVRLRQMGLRYHDIARCLGRSVAEVYGWCEELRRPPLTL